MLYIRILEQNEILRLRHVLVLVSLPDKVSMFVELLTGNGTYTANILSTPCPRVSVIKRLSLYEFASKAEILCPLSILERVCIIEVFFKGNV